jgi:UDP-glucose 4-epimerase
MKVFITGGAGFIGSHLATALVERHDEVFVLDDLSTGSMQNIAHLRDRPNFHYRIACATELPLVTELVDLADVTVHLAAAVGVRLIVERPIQTIETNVHGTETVLRAAAKKQKMVLLASTSEVYGNSTKIPFREDDNLVLGPTTHSRWAYACSKALDEWLGQAYWREHQLPVTITRLFNTVGPGQTGRYGMVLPNFARQAITGEPITVYGDGLQSRCFAHVKDVTRAVIRLIERGLGELGSHGPYLVVGGVFNVGSDEEVSIRALAERVKASAGSTSEIVHVPYEQAYAQGFEDMMRRVPDLSKLERTIGASPRRALDEIVRDVIQDQRSRLHAKR